MIREVGINNRIYDYDESRMPAMYADSGDTIIFNAEDFVGNLLTNEKVLKSHIIAEGFVCQPCNGDVYINGAEPGDTLKITIDKVEITADQGTIALFPPDFEIYGKYLDKEETMKVPARGRQSDLVWRKIRASGKAYGRRYCGMPAWSG